MKGYLKKLAALLLCVSLLCAVLTACGGNQNTAANTEDDMSKEVTLTWYIMASEPSGSAEVLAEVNKYLKEKINAKLDLKFVQPGDYKQKMQMVMAANEEYDLVWTAQGNNDYPTNVANGAYLELDQLLEQTPKLKALFSDDMWDATRINGQIYGVPMNQVMYEQRGMWFKKDIVEKYNLPVREIKSLDDLTQIYQTVKDSEPNVIPIRGGTVDQFDTRDETFVQGFYINKDGKVFDKDENNMDNYKIMRDWYQKGFFPADVATMTDEASVVRAGKIFSRYNRSLPGVEAKFHLQYPFEIIQLTTCEPALTRAGIQGTMTAVSYNSKNPVRALKLLELMQTDKYLFNLMAYGIEGRDYHMIDDTHAEREPGSYYVAEYLIGNQFLAYIMPGYEDTVWEETEKANMEAPVDPNIGFSFDPRPVESEISQLSAVSKEFSGILSNGLEDPEKILPQYLEKKDTAGKKKVMDEIQKQYDEWKKGNK